MDAELKTKMVQYLDGLAAALRDGTREIPGIAHEIVSYHLATSILYATIALIMLVLAILWIRLCVKAVNNLPEGGKEDGEIACGMVGLAVGLISFGFLIANVSSALQCWMAPRWYAIEVILDKIKG